MLFVNIVIIIQCFAYQHYFANKLKYMLKDKLLLQKAYVIITIISLALLGTNFMHTPIQAQNFDQQNIYNEANCVNKTNMTSNYLGMTCHNKLVNTNKTISDINTVTSTGWFVVTAWLEKDNNSSSSPTKVMVTTSQNGGQSYSDPSQIGTDSNSSKRNLHLGISNEHVYVTYEQDMGSNMYDVFFTKSDDGGLTFQSPNNLSRSPEDTTDSTLTVDPVNGKWIVTYIDNGIMLTKSSLKTDCGGC